MVGDDIRLQTELRLQVVLIILHTFVHTGLEECRQVEDGLTTLFAKYILGVEGCQRLTAGLAILHGLFLCLEHGFLELLFGTQVGDTIIIDGKLQRVENVVFSGVGLTPRKDTLRALRRLRSSTDLFW